MENLFKKASQIKLRFSTGKGEIATEDLWNLSLESLDKMAIEAQATMESTAGKSFIHKKTSQDVVAELRFEILKAVIAEKLEAKETAKKSAEKKQRVEFLKGILAEKQTADLKGKSTEEIEKMLAELEA